MCVCVAMEFVFPKVGGFFKKIQIFRFRFSANAEETLAGIFFSCFIESYSKVVLSLSLLQLRVRISPNSFHLRHSAGSQFFLGRKKPQKIKLVSSTFYFVLAKNSFIYPPPPPHIDITRPFFRLISRGVSSDDLFKKKRNFD